MTTAVATATAATAATIDHSSFATDPAEFHAPSYFASQPRRTFIRVFWGMEGEGSRMPKVRADAIYKQRQPEFAANNPPVMNYVFGRDNFDCLTAHGFHCRLVSEHPRPHANGTPPSDHAWVHKIEGWLAALSDYEEIVAMDWDIRPLVQIKTSYVFARLREKSDFGANMLQYRQVASPWRRHVDRRKKPSAAFVYLGGHHVAQSIREAFRYTTEVMREPSGTEECAMSWYTDARYGGWPGIETWCRYHETFCCVVPKCWGVPAEVGFQKERLFIYT